MSEGVVYIATGFPFVKEAIISANQVTEVMPHYPITLITDVDEQDLETNPFDNVIHVHDPEYNSGDQITHMDKTPYNRTLLLDTDVYINQNIEDVFDLLDEFDMAASLSPGRINPTVDIESVPESFVEYSTGMVVYKNSSKVRDFLNDWKRKYERDKDDSNWPNQPAFREALYQSEIRIATLPTEYHTVIREPGYVYGTVKAAHGRLLDVGHLSGGGRKGLDVPNAVKKLNKNAGTSRVYTLGARNIRVHTNSRIYRIKYSLIKVGLIDTIKKIVKFKIKPIFNADNN